MNTAAFFMHNFGRHLIKPSNDDWSDVSKVLRQAHALSGKTVLSRLRGWAIVRPGSATIKFSLSTPFIEKSLLGSKAAFAAELAAWDGQEPRIFMLFDKAPLNAQDIFLSVDKRHVRVCTNAGAKTEDWTAHPPVVKGAKP